MNQRCAGIPTEPRWMPAVSDVAFERRHGVLTCRLHVPTELPIFSGHFPDMPIVPGVIQLGWVVALARSHDLVAGPLAGIAFAKFRRILRPGADLNARLEPGREAGELEFQLQAIDFVVSCGRLRFGNRP